MGTLVALAFTFGHIQAHSSNWQRKQGCLGPGNSRLQGKDTQTSAYNYNKKEIKWTKEKRNNWHIYFMAVIPLWAGQ